MTDTSPASTITADVAEFRDHGDEGLPSGYTSTGESLVVELAKNRPDADARVLRVLAARIARAGTANEDPLLSLADIAGALKSLAAAAAALAGQALVDEDGPETLATYAATLGYLSDAADGVAEMGGWF